MIETFRHDGKIFRFLAADPERREKLRIFSADSMTLLVGDNGAGKTRTLNALASAISDPDAERIDPVKSAEKTAVLHYSADPFDSDSSLPTTRYQHLYAKRRARKVELDFDILEDIGITFSTHPEKIFRIHSTDSTAKRIVNSITPRLPALARAFKLDENVEAFVQAYVRAEGTASNARSRQNMEEWYGSAEYKNRELAYDALVNAIATCVSTPERPFQTILLALRATLLKHKHKTVLRALLSEIGLITESDAKQLNARRTFKSHIHDLSQITEALKIDDFERQGYPVDAKTISRLKKINADSYGNFVISGLSSGIAALLEQFSALKKGFERIKRVSDIENIMLLIDEGDAFLHLSWQQKYVSYLNTFIETMRKSMDVSVQVVLATHSPVLMSDFPKDCVTRVFPKDEDSGSAGASEEIVSFGATLQSIIYKTGRAGTIGDFAAKYIGDLAERITKGEEIDLFRIEMIDDPVLRNALYDLQEEVKSHDD